MTFWYSFLNDSDDIVRETEIREICRAAVTIRVEIVLIVRAEVDVHAPLVGDIYSERTSTS